jgi:hypothetical protein
VELLEPVCLHGDTSHEVSLFILEAERTSADR